MNTVQVNELGEFSGAGAFRYGFRPLWDQKKDTFATNDKGRVLTVNSDGMVRNSLLRKDEWEELDAAVVMAASERLNAIQRLQDLGLVKPLGSIGILTSQWNIGSQMTRATVNLTGQSADDRDLQDYNLKGVPVPVIHKSFAIGERTLEASRRLGEGIDVTNAYEASRVVAEELERMFFSGYDELSLNQDTIYGVTNESNVVTESTSKDFGTISNVIDKFQLMLSGLASDNYFGPFEAWVYKTQYTELTTQFYTDGSGESAYDRMLRIPEIRAIHPADYLSAGEVVLVQMTPNVIDLALHELNMVVEWASGDGLTHNFKVMSIAVPRVKSDYGSHSGICYGTNA